MKLIRVLGASIGIMVLLPRLIEKSHPLDMSVHLLIAEEVAEVRILERVVGWKWDFVDVVCVDELFVGVGAHAGISSHA